MSVRALAPLPYLRFHAASFSRRQLEPDAAQQRVVAAAAALIAPVHDDFPGKRAAAQSVPRRQPDAGARSVQSLPRHLKQFDHPGVQCEGPAAWAQLALQTA